MPNNPLHIATSTPAGAVFAFYKANSQNDLARFVEALGGAVGGYVGGVLPDRLDPPSHPGHRSWGHGVGSVAAGAVAWARRLDGWQDGLRRHADHRALLRGQATAPLAAAWYGLLEWALRLLAGFVAGFGAGYLTHIVFDFGTPRCLPLIC
jgi:hypothetical protein